MGSGHRHGCMDIDADLDSDGARKSELSADILHEGGEHLQRILVESALRDDEVGIELRRLDELVMSGADHLEVLLHHRFDRTSPLLYVTLHTAYESDVVGGVHVELQVEQTADVRLEEDEYSSAPPAPSPPFACDGRSRTAACR